MNNALDRSKGALLGLAIGDALGTTLEFRDRGTFTPITDIVGGGPFNLPIGYWTDDTSMALCLGQSLIDKQGFDVCDQMEKYCDWWQNGYYSSTGRCFDIGYTTRGALLAYKETGQAISDRTSRDLAGNGSIMRLSPVPIFYQNNLDESVKRAGISSKTTHSAPQSISGCQYMSFLLVMAISGRSKEELLDSHLNHPIWQNYDLDSTIIDIAKGDYQYKVESQIKTTGYVVDTLEAAMWAFYMTDTFEEGALKIVNLGGDADTTGAVYGQIAGAYYGASGIPSDWLSKLYMCQEIERMAVDLYNLGIEGL
ncbi:MAG: ADP-ribosylglycohydrolase family protein [Bacteroidota bacterium]